MHKNGGYVGLILMLVSVVIMAFLVWKFGVFTGSAREQRNGPQEDLSAIQQAQALKDALEQRDRQVLQQ